MKKILIVLIILFAGDLVAQDSLEKLLKKHNDDSIPYISVEELEEVKKEVVLLDARETNEFEISTINSAYFIGFDTFSIENFTENFPDKNANYVVYCSLGIRSEIIGKKLSKAGYSNIKNLYGGIFEWKNQGFPVVDSTGNETEKVHAFSKQWGKWLKKGTKVYE